MSQHRQTLREYVFDVTRDLLVRGIIRRRQGQTLEQVFAAEAITVIHEIENDLLAVAAEVGAKVVGSASSALETLAQKKVKEALHIGQEVLGEILFGKPTKKTK